MTGSTKVTADDAQNGNGNGKKRDDKKQKNEGTQSGVLGWIEKVGNKLPEPFWLFVILGIITVASSWIGNRIGMQATNPGLSLIHI